MTVHRDLPWWLKETVGTVAGVPIRAVPRDVVMVPDEPFSVRALRLRTIRPTGWQRVLLWEGSVAAAIIAALADLSPAWLPLAMPVLVGAMVKFDDVIATRLERVATRPARSADPRR